jgi:hypothetical protein
MSSIWLQPEERQQQALQTLVDDVARDYHTVMFRPHLTVCGVPDPTALDAAAAYVRECGLLPLRVGKMAVAGAGLTPFRAVFIEVENTPELREFRERLREICGAPPFVPPHISLFYTLDRDSQEPRPDLDGPALAGIAARCGAAIAETQFTLARPVANNSGGNMDVRSWRVTREL